MQNKIDTLESGCPINCPDIGRTLHDADDGLIPGIAGANLTPRLFGQGPALITITDILTGFQQRIRQLSRAITITLQQIKGHALG